MGVLVCEICKEEHDYQSGFFSRHLLVNHDMTLEEYIIITEYDNKPPICACGLCDLKPNFHRGKFKTYAKGHNNFTKRKQLYLEKYGEPICPTCGGGILKWYRGEPRQYCGRKCFPNHWNYDVIKKTMSNIYGVGCGFQSENIKNKIKITNLKKYGYDNPSSNPEIKQKRKETNLKRYGYENPSYDPRVKELLSLHTIENNKDWFRNTRIKQYKNTYLYYQSSYELDFLELCESLSIIDKVKNGNGYKYLKEEWGNRLITDFSIGDYEIEVKSSYIMEKQGGIKKVFDKRDSVISSGKKYIFILDKDYSEFIKIINLGFFNIY